jgi:hypothetical protein
MGLPGTRLRAAPSSKTWKFCHDAYHSQQHVVLSTDFKKIEVARRSLPGGMRRSMQMRKATVSSRKAMSTAVRSSFFASPSSNLSIVRVVSLRLPIGCPAGLPLAP